MAELNQNVETIVILGPLVDPISALPVITVDLTTVSAAVIVKHDTKVVQDITSFTFSLLSAVSGMYGLTARASTLDTLGLYEVTITNDGLILPYTKTFEVVHSSYYGFKYGGNNVSAAVMTMANDVITSGVIGAGAINKGDQLIGLNDLTAAQVNTEVDTALTDIHLDHWLAVSMPTGVPVNGAGLAVIAAADGTWTDFVGTTDSLQAIRDRGDAAWIGAVDINSFVSAIWSAPLGVYAGAGTAGFTLSAARTDITAILEDTNSTLLSQLTLMQGATFDTATDSLEAIRNRGDAAWAGAVDINSFVSAIWSAPLAVYAGAGTAGFVLSAARTDITAILEDTNSTLLSQLTLIQGATFDTSTDSLEAIRNRGDAAWAGAVDINSFVSAIWSAPLADYTTAGTTGANVLSTFNMATAILADTNELQSDDYPARFDTLDAAVAVVDTNVDAVLVDTNELQSDDYPARFTTLDSALAVVDTNVDAVLIDTNELQTDDYPDRFDTLSGLLITLDTNVDAILADTGTDGVAVAVGAINSGQFAAGAIDAAALAADAGTEIAAAVWATVVESQGALTAQNALQITIAGLGGATSNGGAQFLTPNSAAVRVTFGGIAADNTRSAVTLTL